MKTSLEKSSQTRLHYSFYLVFFYFRPSLFTFLCSCVSSFIQRISLKQHVFHCNQHSHIQYVSIETMGKHFINMIPTRLSRFANMDNSRRTTRKSYGYRTSSHLDG